MLMISALLYFFERDRRQLLAVEYWLYYGLYFIYVYFTRDMSLLMISFGTLFWFWKMLVIRRIIESTCGLERRRVWHVPLLILAYCASAFFALRGGDFITYTLPQAVAVFIVGSSLIFDGYKKLKLRGMASA